jgi:hypothetical protein
MRWIKRPEENKVVVDESLVKVKTKADIPSSLLDRRKAAKKGKKLLNKKVASLGLKPRYHGLHADAIPTGTLCYLRKGAKKIWGFDFCTVLKVYVASNGARAVAEVLSPDCKVHTIDTMWLRNTEVQNGNIEEDEE